MYVLGKGLGLNLVTLTDRCIFYSIIIIWYRIFYFTIFLMYSMDAWLGIIDSFGNKNGDD